MLHIQAVPKRWLNVLGLSIAKARQDRSWRQVDLAERLGVTRQTLSRLEKGDPGVAIGYYAIAAWLLDLTVFSAEHHPENMMTSAKRTRPNKTRKLDDEF